MITGSLIQENAVFGLIIILIGIMFLFLGAWIYYSAIRVFGSLIGAIVGVMICYHVIETNLDTVQGIWLIIAYILCALTGSLIGGSLTIVFHYIVFFVAGAFISLIIFEIVTKGLILPDAFQNLTTDQFIDLVTPKKFGIETVVMMVGGIVYMASAHLLIVISLSVLGAFMIAYALDIYVLFPVLSIVGTILQYLITRSNRRVLTVRRRVVP